MGFPNDKSCASLCEATGGDTRAAIAQQLQSSCSRGEEDCVFSDAMRACICGASIATTTMMTIVSIYIFRKVTWIVGPHSDTRMYLPSTIHFTTVSTLFYRYNCSRTRQGNCRLVGYEWCVMSGSTRRCQVTRLNSTDGSTANPKINPSENIIGFGGIVSFEGYESTFGCNVTTAPVVSTFHFIISSLRPCCFLPPPLARRTTRITTTKTVTTAQHRRRCRRFQAMPHCVNSWIALRPRLM